MCYRILPWNYYWVTSNLSDIGRPQYSRRIFGIRIPRKRNGANSGTLLLFVPLTFAETIPYFIKKMPKYKEFPSTDTDGESSCCWGKNDIILWIQIGRAEEMRGSEIQWNYSFWLSHTDSIASESAMAITLKPS